MLTIPGGFATALFHTHKTQNPWCVRARARAHTHFTSVLRTPKATLQRSKMQLWTCSRAGHVH